MQAKQKSRSGSQTESKQEPKVEKVTVVRSAEIWTGENTLMPLQWLAQNAFQIVQKEERGFLAVPVCGGNRVREGEGSVRVIDAVVVVVWMVVVCHR